MSATRFEPTLFKSNVRRENKWATARGEKTEVRNKSQQLELKATGKAK